MCEVSKLKKKVISAGHICLDITPVFPVGGSHKVSDLLKPGKLINMEAADVHTGGSVSNTGLAMKILGANVSLAGKIGDDAFGTLVKKTLEDYGASDGLIVGEGESTSYSVILAIPGIDRIFLHHNGANNTFLAEDIRDTELTDAALFHFGYPPLMRKMYLEEGAELIKLLKKAGDAGAAVSLDLAAVDPSAEVGQARWDKILEKAIPLTDFFVPSVEELCYMLDRERFLQWQERAAGRDITEVLDPETDIRPLADRCMELGAKVLLIKCGAPGLYYRTAPKETLEKISSRAELDCEAWADQEGFEKSYVPDQVLSGTGAGDTTIAAFLTAMLDGYSLEDCVHLAAATGASCVAAYDALSGLKSLDELKKRIDAGWKKYE